METKLSIIVPVYNTEKYIERCMDVLDVHWYGIENGKFYRIKGRLQASFYIGLIFYKF